MQVLVKCAHKTLKIPRYKKIHSSLSNTPEYILMVTLDKHTGLMTVLQKRALAGPTWPIKSPNEHQRQHSGPMSIHRSALMGQ